MGIRLVEKSSRGLRKTVYSTLLITCTPYLYSGYGK